MKRKMIIVFLAIFVALLLSGCRLHSVKAGDVEVWGCSLFSDTGIENIHIEPNYIESGGYVGDTDRIKFIYPPVFLETE